MVAVVAAQDAEETIAALTQAGETVYSIGVISAGQGDASCHVTGAKGVWGAETPWTAMTGKQA